MQKGEIRRLEGMVNNLATISTQAIMINLAEEIPVTVVAQQIGSYSNSSRSNKIYYSLFYVAHRVVGEKVRM